MEAVLGRSGHGGLGVDEEIKRVESNGDEHAGCRQDFALKLGKSRHEFDENEDIKRSSPKQKDQLGCSKDQVPGTADEEKSSIEPDSMTSSFRQKKQENDQLASTRAEMGEVREENERLKMYLGRIMKDYQTLQMQFNNIVQQESAKESPDNSANNELEETELVSLSLGSFSANPKIKEENNKIPTKIMDDGKQDRNEKQLQEGSLSLGLDYKYNEASKSGATGGGGPAVSNPSAVSSFEDQPKEEAGETWPPSKGLMKMAPKRSAEDEVSQQNPTKKARVCVRARCDTPTMNDGCQWRKYGQKISKGNPCPRAYYRCTVAPSCPVRKQVQRCADDMSILITTYEGTHNHTLPVSATAMASTTSAAASMLLSGSSTSSGHRPPTADQLPGFSTLDSSKWSMDKQFYLPNSSSSPYSSFSSSHPTITLDLTSTPSSSSSSSPLLNKFSSSSSSSPNYSLHYPSTSLSFGSSDSNNIMWSNNNINGFLSYGNGTTQTYNLKSQIGTLGLGRQTTSFHANNNNYNNVNYQNYMQKPNPSTSSTNNQVHSLPDTIAAATKAITADPTFQSALAAALTSIIGGGGGGGQGVNNIVQGGGDHNGNNNVVQKLKWGGDNLHDQQFPVSSTSTTTAPFLQTAKGIGGCATTFLNKTAASANSQPAGNLMFLSPNSLSFSASKSASASPGDSAREQPS